MPAVHTPNPLRHQAENFPVASWLCPPALRKPILAIYRFARHADDLADEGDVSAAERRAALAGVRHSLHRCAGREALAPDEEALFGPLRQAIQDHALPVALLDNLLDAFHQDTRVSRYADRAELLDYCRRSANPVGRLLLHLVKVDAPEALQASDAICTGLQLVNFWQDVGVDRHKGRVYLPATDLARHGLHADVLLRGEDSPALRRCIADATEWAADLLQQGRRLPPLVPGRLSWELRLVIEGGLRIAEKIRRLDHTTLIHRPRLTAWDAPLLLGRALRSRFHRP